MNRYGLVFHHLGLAVARPNAATRFLEALGYSIGETVVDPLQNVQLIMCVHAEMPAVEVIFPTATPGPLAPLLQQNTELIYHVCFSTMDLDASLNRIRAESRVIEILPATPAILFENQRVAFYRIAGLGIVELLERRAL